MFSFLQNLLIKKKYNYFPNCINTVKEAAIKYQTNNVKVKEVLAQV